MRKGIVATLALLLGATGVGAQEGEGLAAYDYENLGVRGIAGEVFVVYPNDIESAVGFGGRLDLGFLGNSLRTQLRGGYWSSRLKQAEVDKFADRIADLVEDQNGPPRPTIDLGVIERSAAIAGLDFQWLFNVTSPLRPYAGLGAELYVLSGSGDAIDGTFVESSLDLLTVGASAIGGLEYGLGSVLVLFAEGRASLAADIRSVSLSGGLAIQWN
ncbi:MAG: hypothetical protein OEU54_16190 [Gemmatimonadota bacterium]|nr:hypothetical protein [Gemmatimonadota bacterium]